MNSVLIQLLARVGYVARGFLFVCVGGLTLAAALGIGGRKAGFQEAVRSLLQDSVGGFVAICLAIGLLCFAIWRLIEAVVPSDDRAQSLFQRGVFAASGLFYLGLTAWTLNTLFWTTPPQSGSDQMAREWTSWLLGAPAGPVLIGSTGLAMIAGAVVFLVRGCKRHFKSAVALRREAPALIGALGRYGLIARAFVYAEMGGFLIYAASSYKSREAKGLVGAFQAIEQFEYGYIVLSVTAAGFIAFGLYEFGAAIYRDLVPQRVQPDP